MKLDTINGHRVAIYQDRKAPNSFEEFLAVYVDMAGSVCNEALRESFCCSADGGAGYHSGAMRGRHLGRRVAFKDLPEPVQRIITRDLTPEA